MSTEAQTIADLAVAADQRPEYATVNGRDFAFVPEGFDMNEVHKKDQHGLLTDPPSRVVETVNLSDKDSFIAYVVKYRKPDTIIYGNPQDGRFKAVIDYHDPAKTEGAFSSHNVFLNLQLSEEWKRWVAKDSQYMTQEQFAEFILENQSSVLSPDSGALYDMALDMRVITNADFRRATKLEDGSIDLEFKETNEPTSQGGKFNVPKELTLSLPIWYGEPLTNLKAMLKWRREGASVKFGYMLLRKEFVRLAVFREIQMEIATQTERMVLTGAT